MTIGSIPAQRASSARLGVTAGQSDFPVNQNQRQRFLARSAPESPSTVVLLSERHRLLGEIEALYLCPVPFGLCYVSREADQSLIDIGAANACAATKRWIEYLDRLHLDFPSTHAGCAAYAQQPGAQHCRFGSPDERAHELPFNLRGYRIHVDTLTTEKCPRILDVVHACWLDFDVLKPRFCELGGVLLSSSAPAMQPTHSSMFFERPPALPPNHIRNGEPSTWLQYPEGFLLTPAPCPPTG